MVLFLWAKIGRPKLKTWASFLLSPPMARQLISAITGDEVGKGVAGEEAWTRRDRLRVV
jgi:hypothetical protein